MDVDTSERLEEYMRDTTELLNSKLEKKRGKVR